MKNTFGKRSVALLSAVALAIIGSVALAQAGGGPRTLDAFGLGVYGIVAFVCACGGALTNGKAFLDNDKQPHQWLRLLIDVGQAQFYGFSVWFTCRYYGFDELLAMIGVLAAAFGGTGAIKIAIAVRKLIVAGQVVP
jgi:hypothetical protein